MASSESFGVKEGHGKQVIEWINERATKSDAKLEARLYDHLLHTQNFGNFEMFSWMGSAKVARRLVIQASKRFRVRIIEGGYKTRESIISTTKIEYAMVRDGDKVVGKIKFETSRLGRNPWRVKLEEPS